ncbi:MAG TPA: hypothetical protein VGO11_19255 [Chthoniobacteraceae bacterium]|jgi:hypothetical protein|nr:hypothetical protein [Chthoniobacteraceae bacterium]
MRLRLSHFLSAALWLAVAGAHAQTLLPETRRDVAAQSAPPALAPLRNTAAQSGATLTAGSGSAAYGRDFGEQEIVNRRAHPEPWTASADGQFFYTNNVALTPSDRHGDWYGRYGATISYTNRIKGPVFLDFGLQEYFFRYARYNALDFDLTRFQGGLLLQVPKLDDTFLFARYRLERITEAGFGSTLLTSHVAELGLQKVWKISRGQQISAGLEADLPLDTDPRSAAREEYGLTLGYSLRLTEHLNTVLSYRGAYYRYSHTSRTDWNHILALDATYDLTDWARLGASVSFTSDTSNAAFGDYQNLVAGGSLSLRLSF